MVAQAAQPANVLVIAAAQCVRQQISQQSADKAQQQRFTQRQDAAAGQRGQGK